MNALLIFFALPIAVIIFSIALQKLLKCPALVAAIIFAIFLIVTFIVSNLIFLVATIVYAILSYITAVIVCLITRLLKNRDKWNCSCNCRRNSNCERQRSNNDLLTISSNCQNLDDGNLLTISSSGCNGVSNDLLTVNTNCNGRINYDNNGCACSDNIENNTVNARIRVVPNCENNGRSGAFSGCYRRRN